ncbi:hypothetical protein AVEN_37913-1 [Araneus ventricosus]|uniref:Uncharacterized protein n=1 Tax=Araneus ventricosus TaxID=182803 RepID=A0A4Y2UHG9_ARAVE|nr:hypothetical protein AVEN_37913-1 [Araneus ventricosus]
MYLAFAILCLLLLLFNLEPVPGRPADNHYVMNWTFKEYRLVKIMPSNWYVLVDEDVLYMYLNTDSLDTYIPAIRLDSHHEVQILHYQYLLEWIKDSPVVMAYPKSLKDMADILNHITSSLKSPVGKQP